MGKKKNKKSCLWWHGKHMFMVPQSSCGYHNSCGFVGCHEVSLLYWVWKLACSPMGFNNQCPVPDLISLGLMGEMVLLGRVMSNSMGTADLYWLKVDVLWEDEMFLISLQCLLKFMTWAGYISVLFHISSGTSSRDIKCCKISFLHNSGVKAKAFFWTELQTSPHCGQGRWSKTPFSADLSCQVFVLCSELSKLPVIWIWLSWTEKLREVKLRNVVKGWSDGNSTTLSASSAKCLYCCCLGFVYCSAIRDRTEKETEYGNRDEHEGELKKKKRSFIKNYERKLNIVGLPHCCCFRDGITWPPAQTLRRWVPT